MRKYLFSLVIATLLVAIPAAKIQFSQNNNLTSNPSPQGKLITENLTGEYDYSNETGYFMGKKVRSTPYISQLTNIEKNVLGIASTGPKMIQINLTEQKLYAYENGVKIHEFLISSGRNNWTPTTDNAWVWIKLKSTLMRGADYYLPNVPFTMYFEGTNFPRYKGYGIHGAYWHNNFGTPMSHGCINLSPQDAEKLFYWAEPYIGDKSVVRSSDTNPGTRIMIYGKYEKK